jgi:hypothetical protein
MGFMLPILFLNPNKKRDDIIVKKLTLKKFILAMSALMLFASCQNPNNPTTEDEISGGRGEAILLLRKRTRDKRAFAFRA